LKKARKTGGAGSGEKSKGFGFEAQKEEGGYR